MADKRFDECAAKSSLVADDQIPVLDSEDLIDGNPKIKKGKLSEISHNTLKNKDTAGNHAKLIPSADGTTALQITKADGTTVVLNFDTTNLITGMVKAIINYGHATESYQITERGMSLGFPVATIQPFTTNKECVLDLMPKGTPSPENTNGMAWFDVCNADVLGVNPAFNAFRIGMRSDKGQIGVLSYGGGTNRELEFVVGAVAQVAGKIKTDKTLQWLENVIFDKNLTVTGNVTLSGQIVTDVVLASKTLQINADVAKGYLATFASDLAYDSGLFQSTVRLLSDTKALILAAGNATNGDIIFVAGGQTISSYERFRIKADGSIIIKNSKTPASAEAAGTAGEIAWDSNYFYVCVAANTWKRTAIATW